MDFIAAAELVEITPQFIHLMQHGSFGLRCCSKVGAGETAIQ